MAIARATTAGETGKRRIPRKRLVILGLLLILSVLFVCVFPMIVNNVRLSIFSQPFFNYPLPPQTAVLSRETQVGLLHGNGNHCDFSASMRLHTLLSEQEVRDYYSEALFPTVEADSGWAAISGLEGAVPVILQFDQGDPHYFFASIADSTYRSWLYLLDPRCN
jgi:hypothetical protein